MEGITMCKWHKLVAKTLATDPQDGVFDVGKYAVALTAMSINRVEQEKWGLPSLYSIDGFNPDEILKDEVQKHYRSSSSFLDKTEKELEQSLARQIDILRDALNNTDRCCDITSEGLNIYDNITSEGYKKTCCSPANPRENGPFLDASVVYLFKGYDTKQRARASGDLELITFEDLEALQNDPSVAQNDKNFIPLLDGVRQATEFFLSHDGVLEALDGSFKSSIAYIFSTAQADSQLGRGLKGPSDCIMCEGTKGRKGFLSQEHA